MLLETILPPHGEGDFFSKNKLQLVAVSEEKMGLGATVEDVVYGLIPGVAARSVLLPLTPEYRNLYVRAVDDVVARVKTAKGSVRKANRDRATVNYQYRDETGEITQDVLHVRLLHTDVAFMQIAGEAGEHAEDPPVDFRKVRAELVELIGEDKELPNDACKTLLIRARNPSYPVSALTLEYARAKKEEALRLLAIAHAPVCARAAYAAVRELTQRDFPDDCVLRSWGNLTNAEREAIVMVTVKVIGGQTTPFQHGEMYGPLFLGVIQQALMHVVGAADKYERERRFVSGLLRRDTAARGKA